MKSKASLNINIIDKQKKYYFLLLILPIISLFYNCDSHVRKNSDTKEIAKGDTIINEKQEVLTRDAGTLKFITHRIPGKNIMGYWQYIPEKHHQNQTWPMLLFLHGGEKFFFLDTAAPDNPSFLEKKHVFTSFDKKGHDAWTETYASRQIYQWMLNFQNINGKIISKENRYEKIYH